MSDEPDALGRAHRSNGYTDKQRIGLLERDMGEHSRILGALVDREKGFTEEQKAQLHDIFREVLADSGLRIDEAEQVDAAREDFRFVRRLRLKWEGAANKVGNGVLTALILFVIGLFSLGFWAWLQSGGGK